MKIKHRLNFPWNLLYITLAVIAFVTLLCWAGLFNYAELKSLDIMYKLRGVREPEPEIIVVAIDNLTLTELGMKWPLSNILHAQVITQLKLGGAHLIEVVFPLNKSIGNSGDDEVLASSLAKAGIVWLPEEFSETSDSFYIIKTILEPEPVLKEAAAGVAFINLVRDDDGFIRRILPIESYQEKIHYHMTTIAYSYLRGLRPSQLDQEALIINYAGPSHTFKTVSYYQVLEGLLPAQFFQDKVVLIGLDLPDIGETFPTPFSGEEPMSRVEIIANGLGSLLSQTQLHPVDLPASILIVLLVVAIVAIMTASQPIFRGFIFIVITGGLYFLIAFLLFTKQQIWLPMVYPLVGLTLTYSSISLYRYNLEQQQKKQLRRLFSRYVSDEVVKEILKQSDAQVLNGKRSELTVLFSDIRGFTSLCQKLAPETVVTMLNEYLSAMTEVIFQNKGTIDKFMGDGIMVIFGAPLQFPDSALRAINTAIQMQRKMQEMESTLQQKGFGHLKIGIGIHTGEAIIGNIGSPKRMSYTAIGDTVNISSRLQELTKTYDYSIIISEATYKNIQSSVPANKLGSVMLRGRNEQIVIYGIILPETVSTC